MDNPNTKDYYMVWVRSIKFTQPLTEENRPTVLIKKMATCLDHVGLLQHFGFYNRTLNSSFTTKSFKLTNILKQFDRLAVKDLKTPRHLNLYTEQVIESYTAEAEIEMQIDSTEAEISLLFTKQFIQNSGFTLEKLIEFFTCVYDTFSDIAVIGYQMDLTMHSRGYPRPKPPRQHPRFARGSMIEAYSKKFNMWDKRSTPEKLQKLYQHQLPVGIKSWWYNDDLWFVQWVEDWLDDQHVAQRRTLQEKWISAASDALIESGYNEFGDHREISEKHMTPVDDLDCLGIWSKAYKKSTVDDHGRADAAVIALLQKYLSLGVAPSGRSVKEAYILVNTRQQALAIHDQVTKAGLQGVMYLADDGYYYDPFPKGMWEY